MTWSAAQYVKFEDERNRPVLDLLGPIRTADVTSVADIGSGPGNSTALLRKHYPQASITGIDNSADMVEAARRRLPEVTFHIDDIATWRDPGPFDIILANAALQWIPDHASLFPRLIDKLAMGGTLAVQMPDNLGEPAHQLMREIAADGPWADKLSGAAGSRAPRHDPSWYFRLLHGTVGVVDIWRTTYYHPLAGSEAIVEWFKGSGLRPYLDPLNPSERDAFLGRYQTAIDQAYPSLSDGTVLLPFPRLFILAQR